MSTLSKVFVILVLLVAVMKLGVDVALFAHRVDWKDKYIKEADWNVQNQQMKNAEIADLELQKTNFKEYIGILGGKIQLLESEAHRRARGSGTSSAFWTPRTAISRSFSPTSIRSGGRSRCRAVSSRRRTRESRTTVRSSPRPRPNSRRR
jgi:hypothetical protein